MVALMLLSQSPHTPQIEASGPIPCCRKGAIKKKMGAVWGLSIEGHFQKPAHLLLFCPESPLRRALCCASFSVCARLCLFFARLCRKTAQALFSTAPFSLSLYIIEKKEERGGISSQKHSLGGAQVFAMANKEVRKFCWAAQLISRTFAHSVSQCFSHFCDFEGQLRGCAGKSAPTSFGSALK